MIASSPSKRSSHKLRVLIACLTVIFIALSAVSCAIILSNRISVENRNKTYDIVLDYHEAEALARQSDHDISWWLEQFKHMKINKVGLAEESLRTLTESRFPVNAVAMGVLLKDAGWRFRFPADWIDAMEEHGFDIYDVMVEMRSKEMYDFVTNGVISRYGEDKIVLYPEEDGGYALILGSPTMSLFTPRYKEQNSKGGGFVELIDIVDSKLMYLSLGLMPSKVEAIQANGLSIIPRTSSYETWNGSRYAQAVIDGYRKYGITPKYFIAGGEGIPGCDDGIKLFEGYLSENNIKIGLIEDTTQLQNIEQRGILQAISDSDYRSVRVFSVWNYIQNRYMYYGYAGAEEIENTLFRAVVERNIRVIYYKPIKETKDFHTYITNIEEYRTMFSNLEARLAEHGIYYGDASVMDAYKVPFILKLFMAWGCIAAAMLLLQLFFPLPAGIRLLMLLMGIAGSSASFYVMPFTSELIISLVNSIVFACLAVVFIIAIANRRYAPLEHFGASDDLLKSRPVVSDNMSEYLKSNPAQPIKWPGFIRTAAAGMVTLIIAVLIALAGGLMTAAPLSSINYMLEIDIFRGVKAAQLLPIAFFIVAYLAYFGFGKNKYKPGQLEFGDIYDLMNTPIKIWMILLSAVVGAVGIYYILRTGHEVITATRFEMLFRNDLENMLLARPRTKEFLIGFPAIMLLIYSASRRLRFWTIMSGFGSVIGITSVINTFMHLRTPLYLGFFRTGMSVLFGLAAGIVALVVFDLLYRAYLKMKSRGFFSAGI